MEVKNMARICIPDYEYKERVQRCAAILRRENLDALIVNGNEADYANPRYFSGFWKSMLLLTLVKSSLN